MKKGFIILKVLLFVFTFTFINTTYVNASETILNEFEVDGATLSFNYGDDIIFTGSTSSNVYSVDEHWTYRNFYEWMFYETIAMPSGSILNYGFYDSIFKSFDTTGRYYYSLSFKINEEYIDQYKFGENYSDVTITLNGKKYVRGN